MRTKRLATKRRRRESVLALFNASLEGREKYRARESKSIARRKGRVSGEGIRKHRSKEGKSIGRENQKASLEEKEKHLPFDPSKHNVISQVFFEL
ncbi:MAG: hypothetical protein D3913_00365 [Candidatus Electrothrix sp. LOE1_4_5]|nr:hypothetical protein [Candidatus Electrothrix gigas]